jgi:hypothetical protein
MTINARISETRIRLLSQRKPGVSATDSEERRLRRRPGEYGQSHPSRLEAVTGRIARRLQRLDLQRLQVVQQGTSTRHEPLRAAGCQCSTGPGSVSSVERTLPPILADAL